MSNGRPFRWRAMLRDRAAGMSFNALARKYRRSSSTIAYWIKKCSRPPGLTPFLQQRADRNEAVATMLLRGMTLKQVAHETGLSYANVWHIGRTNGVKRRRDVLIERNRRWTRRLAAGETLSSIARSEGAALSTVHSAIRRFERVGR